MAAVRPAAKRMGSGMDTRARMVDELSRRRAGFSLPRPFYTDPDFLRLDHETIFYRTGCSRATTARSRTRGHYFTMQVGDYPIIVLRADDGEVRAFHNTCRHRGSRICTRRQGQGGAARLPLPPVELRPRRSPHPGPQHGRGVRSGPLPPRARSTPAASAGSSSSASPTRRPTSSPSAPGSSPTSPRTGSARRRSRTRRRSSSRATGSWSGRTTASATTAPPTIPSCAGRFPRRRPPSAPSGRRNTPRSRRSGTAASGRACPAGSRSRPTPGTASCACRWPATR